ncbi:cyclase family protein [Klebsiella variicola]
MKNIINNLEGLWGTHAVLKACQWIDLSHPVDETTPIWEGFPAFLRQQVFNYQEHSFQADYFCHVGQWGTHVDPPSHFHAGLDSLEAIPVQQMLLPLCVIDLSAECRENPDTVLTIEHLLNWESRHGTIPSGSFIAMRSDWSLRWPSKEGMLNKIDGTNHTPGWSTEAIDWLCLERDITAIGHETLDTDPGIATHRGDYSAERTILGHNRYQIEVMAHLDQLPEAGALIVVAFPKIIGASGFPARVFALMAGKNPINK